MIELDGSFGEGGGQILRTSLALALLTGKAFHLRNIRAGRKKPGLQPQHLMCVRAAGSIGQAQLRGDSLGSSDLVFEPASVVPGKYTFSIGTAGATGLVLHTLYLPLALQSAPSELTILGGTHVTASPCFHFLDVTWRHYMAVLGLQISLRLRRPGFYPRGGGVIEAHIQPGSELRGFEMGGSSRPDRITGVSAVAGLPEQIAQRQTRRAVNRLRGLSLKVDLQEETWPGGPGTVLLLELNTQPVPTVFFGLGARGKPAERVADEAVEQVLAFLDAEQAGVDPHSADQLVLPLVLAQGPSTFPVTMITSHLSTNVAVIRQFVERAVVCEGQEGDPGIVRIAV
jgi:RNA 3'-phosphate cyclase